LKSDTTDANYYEKPTPRINTLIDLSTEKVVNQISISSGEKCVLCRCWKSAKFPLCDGAHVKHNRATGDNVGPVIVTANTVQGIL